MKRRSAEAALAAARQGPSAAPAAPAAAAILAALPFAVVVLDAGDRFIAANAAAEQFLGRSAAGLARRSLAELVAPGSVVLELVRRARQGGGPVSGRDLVLAGPHLPKAALSVHAAPMPDAPGEVVLAFLDGSAAHELDRQLALHQAGRGIAGMAALLAHEVKNPLSGIRGAAQLLEASLGEADRGLARLIRDEVDRIGALLTRIEQFGSRPAPFAPVNINQVLHHVKRLAEQGFARDHRIIEAYDPSLPPVPGDRDQLVQVILNLVKNAAEAAPAKAGVITLGSAWRHGMRLALPGRPGRAQLPLVVTVEDNGAGIDPGLRPRLFEPFVTGKAGGQGLGLALVARIVGDHAGVVEVDSAPGHTIFRLLLPVVASPGPLP